MNKFVICKLSCLQLSTKVYNEAKVLETQNVTIFALFTVLIFCKY